MKTAKKFLALALAMLMVLALAACGSSAPAKEDAAPAEEAAAPAEEAAAPAEEAAAPASNYPTKDIYVVCPWGAGGGTDACLRALCQAMSEELGVNLTVDNLTGGGGIIGHEAIANADKDGYNIGMITFELSTYPSLGTDLSYENYDLIGRVNTDAAALSVNAKWAESNGISDLASFVEYAKANPGIQLGGSANASVWHIAGGYLEEATGIDVEMITYQGGAADAVKAAASGEIQGVTVSLAEASSFLQSGDLICLGVMDSARNPKFADVATFQEQGVDVVYGTWRGMAAPKGLDEASLTVLREACAKACENATFVETMANLGQAISYQNADDFAAFLKDNAEAVQASMAALGLDQAA